VAQLGRSQIVAPVPSAHETWLHRAGVISAVVGIVLPVFLVGVPAAVSREKDPLQHGAGLIMNIPFPEDQVAQVVQDVVQNGIIRGTKEYNKDPYVSGATSVDSTRLFRKWDGGGEVFYKQRLHAVDPRNFKDSSDVGTLIVRYILQPQGSKNTVLRINALFVEDFRHTVHQSTGSVEEAEYADIHERLDKISAMNAETAELQRQKKAGTTGFSSSQSVITATTPTQSAATPVQEVSMAEAKAAAIAVPQSLDERVKQLRRDVERVVKAPGAALKSAPFHSAVTLQPLPAGTEVLVVITTTYWLGVETHDGLHGWVMRDDLEQLP
jgi:hypothetical protein